MSLFIKQRSDGPRTHDVFDGRARSLFFNQARVASWCALLLLSFAIIFFDKRDDCKISLVKKCSVSRLVIILRVKYVCRDPRRTGAQLGQ